jgi:hypothetical protein
MACPVSLDHLMDMPNLVVLHSLSKSFHGLAIPRKNHFDQTSQSLPLLIGPMW